MSRTIAAGLVLLVVACSGGGDVSGPVPQAGFLQLQEVLGTGAGLSGPIDLQAPPGDARLFIAERRGRLRIVQGGMLLPDPFLDISGRIVFPYSSEDGLLSFAFHPQYASGQPYVFVHFTDRMNGANDIVVERYEVSMDPNVLLPTGTEVIRIPHPGATNHYGGRVAFGPDGMLYLSTGDGGGSNDQFDNGQNTATLLGKLLRLDVGALPYTIPADNPTWPGAMPRRENWAIGLRNPFRYSFDVPAGLLYIGDVGQGQREEIDAVPATAAGLNYGWNVMEGTLCFAGPCPTPGLTLPAHEYDHGPQGGCSITGGYVYRGTAIPELVGRYLYSDYCGGFLRSLRYENGIVTERLQWLTGIGNVYSFGQDGAGELYILTANGRVLRIAKQ
jgi:glucose/arabinose dehydrogenase